MKDSKARNKIYQNYFGSKNGSGVAQQIINQIRPHDIYMELFVGSGAIFQNKKPASINYINDKDENVYGRWMRSGTDGINCTISNLDAVYILNDCCFETPMRYVIYLDPPYPLGSRRSSREVYNYEMTDQQHVRLLETVLKVSADHENVDFLISSYENEIYREMLKGWNVHTFQAQTRKGIAIEHLYMNYSNPEGILHQYDYLGVDYIDRQRIKRKIERKVTQLKELPAAERQAIIQALTDLA